MRKGPNIRKRADGRFEARYERGRDEAGHIVYGYCYGKTYEEAEEKRKARRSAQQVNETGRVVRRMNLMILGAGSQGPVVKEAAQALCVFREIAYLDDDPENELAMDSCANYNKYIDRYPIALPSFGNNELRKAWIERLEEAGFIVPSLIHPMATVSPSANVGDGVMIEAKAIIGTNSVIGKGSIISSGAVVDTNAQVGEYCHVDSASTVLKNALVAPYSVVPGGTTVESDRGAQG